MLSPLLLALLCFACFAAVVQLASAGLILWRMARRQRAQRLLSHPPITVIRPVCGTDPFLYDTLASTFHAAGPGCEILFCVDDPGDPAIPTVRAVIAAHPGADARLLTGRTAALPNPKLGNMVKGWAAARHPWIAMIDSNVMLPADYIQTLFGAWQPGTGLVTSPPVGTRPGNMAARIEAGFLNSFQDRWQLAADQLGHGFAQGKVLFWQRATLDEAGGLTALGRDLAEDVAATKVVHAAGLKVRLIPQPFPQPLGRRSFAEVWQRQVRWARVRRAGFPAIFAFEPLAGAALPLLAVVALCLLTAQSLLWPVLFAALWYGVEALMARRAGWAAAPLDVASWMIRDALIPAVWCAALVSRDFVWRGHAMGPSTPAMGLPE